MTQQIRDMLHFEEKEYKLNCYILEPYFNKNPKLTNTRNLKKQMPIETYIAEYLKAILVNMKPIK